MHSREGGGHLEIFLLCYGIKLVIVTTGTMHGQPKEALRHRSHDVFHFILPHNSALLIPGGLKSVKGPTDKKSGCGNSTGMIRLEHVAGNLPLHELIVRHILIEGINHPVPIRPSVGAELIIFKSVTLTITRHIQPVPSPALSVMRRRKKGVNVCSHPWLRRQTGQPEVQSSSNNPFTRFRSWLQSLLLQFSEDEGVDRIAHPPGIFHGRNLWTGDRLKGPPALIRSVVTDDEVSHAHHERET